MIVLNVGKNMGLSEFIYCWWEYINCFNCFVKQFGNIGKIKDV